MTEITILIKNFSYRFRIQYLILYFEDNINVNLF